MESGKARRSVATSVLAVAIFAVLIGYRLRTINIDWLRVWHRTAISLLYLNAYGVPFFALAGTLISLKRRTRTALAICAVGLSFSVSAVITPFFETYYYEALPPWPLRILALPSPPLAVIAIALLTVQHLRGWLDRLRLVGVAIYAAFVLANVLTYLPVRWSYNIPVECARTVLGFISYGLMLYLSWCLAFRQVVPNRPPVDTKRRVALACPRCGSAQEISAGHGRCSVCRLDISISLNEGVCENCGYALRGLTGGKCPECGSPIFEAEVAAAPAAGSPRGE